MTVLVGLLQFTWVYATTFGSKKDESKEGDVAKEEQAPIHSVSPVAALPPPQVAADEPEGAVRKISPTLIAEALLGLAVTVVLPRLLRRLTRAR